MLLRVRKWFSNTTFNPISVTSWQSASLVEQIGIPRENNRPAVGYWQTLPHEIVLNDWMYFSISWIPQTHNFNSDKPQLHRLPWDHCYDWSPKIVWLQEEFLYWKLGFFSYSFFNVFGDDVGFWEIDINQNLA